MKIIYRLKFLLFALLFASGLMAQPAEFAFPGTCTPPITNGFSMIGIVLIDGASAPAGEWVGVFNAADAIVGRGQLQSFEFPTGSGTFVNGFSIRIQDSPAGDNCPTHTLGDNLSLKYFDPVSGTVLTSALSPFAGGATSNIIDGPDGVSTDVDFYNFTSPLPVTLTEFTATPAGATVNLNWTTSEERDNSHFEIERSSDPATGFVNIGKVQGNNTTDAFSDYEFVDVNPAEGVNYYRLRQVDFDGTAERSPVVVAEMEVSAERNLSVFPNPAASNGRLTIRLGGDWAKGATNVRLVDVAGRLVTEWTNVNAASLNTELPTLPAGIYQLIASDDIERKAVRLMVR